MSSSLLCSHPPLHFLVFAHAFSLSEPCWLPFCAVPSAETWGNPFTGSFHMRMRYSVEDRRQRRASSLSSSTSLEPWHLHSTAIKHKFMCTQINNASEHIPLLFLHVCKAFPHFPRESRQKIKWHEKVLQKYIIFDVGTSVRKWRLCAAYCLCSALCLLCVRYV